VSDQDVKVKVTADASQATAEMGKLKKGVDDAGTAAKKAGGGFTDFAGALGKGLVVINQGLELANKAMDGFKKAFDMAEQATSLRRLEESLPTNALKRIDAAFGGAASKADALKLASKGLRGDFALTVPQMEDIARAAEAAARRGFGPAAENATKMLKAFQEGNIEKLDDFGIKLEKTGIHAVDVANGMAKIRDLARDTGPIDAQTASIREMGRGFEDLKGAIKGVIVEVVNGVTKVYEKMKEGGFLADLSGVGGAIDYVRMQKAKAELFLGPKAAMNEAERIAQARQQERDAAMRGRMGHMGSAGLTGGQSGKGTRGAGRGFDLADEGYTDFGTHVATGNVDLDMTGLHGGAATGDWAGPSRPGTGGGKSNQLIDDLVGLGMPPGVAARLNAVLASSGEAGPASVYSKDNPLSSFFDSVTQKSQIAGEALAAFGGAAISAFAAALDGSKSFGDAMKEASAAALRSLAVEWAARALGEVAWGFSALANPLTAATAPGHFAAAAKWGAAAAAAGAGSALLSSGGSGGSRGEAGGGFAKPTNPGGGSGQGDVINVYIGAGFYGDRKDVTEAIAKGVRDAKRRGARESYTSSFKRG
jgi:hypothetical protein